MSQCADEERLLWYRAGRRAVEAKQAIQRALDALKDGSLSLESIDESVRGDMFAKITENCATYERLPAAILGDIKELTNRQNEVLAHLFPSLKTFFMIKPGFLDYKEAIVQMLCSAGRLVDIRNVTEVPAEIIERHYAEHRGKDFFQWNVDYFRGKPVVVGILEGPNVIYRTRRVIGDTDPAKAHPESIRGIGYEFWGAEPFDKTRREKRALDNVVHASSGLEDAGREIRIWDAHL